MIMHFSSLSMHNLNFICLFVELMITRTPIPLHGGIYCLILSNIYGVWSMICFRIYRVWTYRMYSYNFINLVEYDTYKNGINIYSFYELCSAR